MLKIPHLQKVQKHIGKELSICLSVHLSICLFVYLSICLSVYLSICLFVHLSICLIVYLSNCLFVYLPICLNVGCEITAFYPNDQIEWRKIEKYNKFGRLQN